MRRSLMVLAILMLAVSTWLALTKGQITPVQRNILYVHVPNSIGALLCFTLLLVASVGYLITGQRVYDLVANASAEVGIVLASILNGTGMIFSRAEWGVWWTPSPRLVTSALLWFLYVVYLILRTSLTGSYRRCARICAVFGILAFLDVPMVYVSARFIPDIHRPDFSFDSVWQTAALLFGLVGTLLLAGSLIWLRTDVLRRQAQVDGRLCR